MQDGFEIDEVAVATLEKIQDAVENKKVSGLFLTEHELSCMLKHVQDLIDELDELTTPSE